MTPEELRRDNHLSWLWCIAALRERVSGEPAEENFLKWVGRMTTAVDELADAVAEQRAIDRAKKAAWRYAYYNDPAHPERKERKRWRARELARRNRAEGRIYSDTGTVPCGLLRQSERQIRMLDVLMAGRRYG